MSASFRSHFRAPPQQGPSSSQQERTQSSQIPTKASSSNSDYKQNKGTQHVSKLAKRASRSTTSSDKTEHGTQSTTTPTPTQVTTAYSQSVGPKIASVLPQSQVAPTGTPAPSISRHNNVPLPPPTIRTPSLFSGSSASTIDSPRSNALRRKPSTIEQYAASKRAETPKIDADSTTMHKENDEFSGAFEESILGISLPQTKSDARIGDTGAHSNAPLAQDVFRAGRPVTRDITPPVPNYAQTATPSTRYTDSPFSHVPTPSSASSYSSGVVATANTTTPRTRQQSPTRSRPPVTGRSSAKGDVNRLGLPPVRESSTSSSNSTVKPSESRSALPRRDVPQKPASAPPAKTKDDPSQTSLRGKLTIKDKPKPSSTPSTAQPPVQIPPELAHLNVEPPLKPSLNKPFPPLRPSRDGTPTLAGMNVPSPVVQSDLPRLYTTYHKRTPSQETPTSATSPSFKTRFGLSSKAPSKQYSPRIDSAVSPPPAARAFARGPAPDEPASEGSRVIRKDSPAVGPSQTKSPRFGFFSRKPKADNAKTTEKPKRQPSKGPAAGTGHEGYGRFGIRSRSSSISSNTGFRSPSTESNTSSQKKRQSAGKNGSVASKDGSDLDDFLRERLSPVILRGSGSTFSNTASSSEAQLPSVPDSSKNSSLDSIPKPQLLPSAMDSMAGMSPAKASNHGWRVPSDSSEDDVTSRYPTLASSRSLTQPSHSYGNSTVKVSTPMDPNRPSKDSSFDSYDAENSVCHQTDSTMPTEDPFGGKEGLWLRSGKVESESKASRKWNFFQRAHASPRDKSKAKETATPDNSNSTAHQSPYRGIAHYAMLDPVEPVGLEEVERIMLENETSAEESMSESNAPPKMVPYERRHTSLLPSPPKQEYSKDFDFKAKPSLPRIRIRPDSEESTELMHAEKTVPHQAPHVVDIRRSPVTPQSDPWAEQKAMVSDLKPEVAASHDNVPTPDTPQAPFNTPENPENDSPARQPRLSPVGRIPKVVSKRDRERKLSDSSFSRPFARSQPKPTVKPPGSLYNQIRELASPIESVSQPVSSTSTNSNGTSGEQPNSVDTVVPSGSSNRASTDMYGNKEYFSIPARKDSEISYSSSSGNNSVRAIMAAQPPQEDDVWNEYNDWLDEVMLQKTPYSTASSLGAPFQYSTALYDSPALSGLRALNQPPPQSELPAPPRPYTVPAVLSVPQQVERFMQPLMSPLTTPQALSEVVDHYGNRSTSTLATANRTSGQSANRSSIPQPHQSSIPSPSRPNTSGPIQTSISGPTRSSLPRSSRSSLPGPNRSSLPRSDRASVQGSLTSSARHSRSSGHSRSASLPEANARNSQSSFTPSARFNRDTQLLDIAEVDGDEQAAAANLRFGALMTSKWLSFGRVLFSPAHNEMRLADEPRVLIIDGLGSDWSYYVALSYPAATIYNLGPALANGLSDWPGVNQKPPLNHRHINHAAISAAFPFPKGFFTAVVFRFPLATTDQAYQACVFECKRVLRPGGYLEIAALDLDLMNMGNKARKEIRGLKTRMQQHDRNVSLRNLSDVLVRLLGRRGFEEVQRCIVGVPAAGRIPRSQDISSVSSGGSGKPVWQREDRRSQEFSFADLLEDARASQTGQSNGNDENITKMVAKVGRWWYSTCYEKALLQTDNSIWNDNLLRECEKQGTSFRLLICYAQKPAQTKRRTVSV